MTLSDGRAVLRFYIAPSWDAQQYVHYRYAPDGWDDMTKAERQEFLDEESRQFMEESIEYGAAVHDYGAERPMYQWESGGDPSEPEEVY